MGLSAGMHSVFLLLESLQLLHFTLQLRICLQAFKRLGVDTSSLGMESIGKVWRDTHESTITEENESECPYDWLAVQQVQDKGGTWGEAIQELPRHKI